MTKTIASFSGTSVCDNCCSDDNEHDAGRRAAISKGVLATISAVLASACAPSVKATSAATPALGSWALRVKASDFPALANTWGVARVDGASDKPVAVVKTSDGYAAYSLRCPHAGVTIEPKEGKFVCPGHGAEFKLDGSWTGGHRAKDLKKLTVTFDSRDETLLIVG